jgi:hypothetical protein
MGFKKVNSVFQECFLLLFLMSFIQRYIGISESAHAHVDQKRSGAALSMRHRDTAPTMLRRWRRNKIYLLRIIKNRILKI